jgi:hypothetical protein
MTFPEKSVENRARAFFDCHGVSARPRLDDTCDGILSLLEQRRDDPSFWVPLTDLLRDVVHNAIASGESGWRAVPQAELLAAWDADDLAQKLREALMGDESAQHGADRQPRRAAWERFACGLSPTALTAFLLLGLAAAGCSSSTDPVVGAAGSTTTGGAAGAGAAVAGSGGSGGQTAGGGGTVASSGGADGQTAGAGGAVAGSGGSVEAGVDASNDVVVNGDAAVDVEDAAKVCTAELYQTIQASSLSAASKQAVYTCLINLKASWCDGLVTLFATRSPSQIAAILENLAMCCQSMPSRLTGEYTASTQSSVVSGMLCAVPLYRGVAFPD